MNVVVCAKLIPDPAEPGSLAPDHTLVRPGKLILDDADRYGVEVGLQLAEQAGGGEVVVVAMAPAEDLSGLRSALSMGAARAILVRDEALAGSDALGTAKVLAAAIRSVGPDLVVAATESTDGYTGTMPVQVAELLGFPSISFAKRVEVVDGTVRVDRQTEGGYDEVEAPLPALVTVTAGTVEPRYPSFKAITEGRKRPIDVLGLADLGIDPDRVGRAGAGQEILSVEPAEVRAGGEVVVDEGDGHQRILALLESWRVA